MNKIIISILLGLVINPMIATAQIGYQVSLLNNVTGEPRADEIVDVKIEITNAEGHVICSEVQNATSNDFGVLSLSVGSSTTFDDVDWSKTPFYVSATIDDVLIGKSQILSVPIAEAAKTLVNIDPVLLSGTWRGDNATLTFSFSDNIFGSCTITKTKEDEIRITNLSFEIEGNTIWCYEKNSDEDCIYMRYHNGYIYVENDGKFSH